MKKLVWALLPVVLLIACGESGVVKSQLQWADSLMTSSPDSAWRVLRSWQHVSQKWKKEQRMYYGLLLSKAQNKAYIDFSTDSLVNAIADYYNKNGSANDRLMAHYLLGCCYRDLGETPRAVACLQDAVNYADTLAPDCDFATLGCVYSQMADLYHRQLLLSHEIDARRWAKHYAEHTGDTIAALYDQRLIAGAYILQNKRDSAETMLRELQERYLQDGYVQEDLQTSMMLLYLYVEQPEKADECKKLIERFEAGSRHFDENHELPPSKRQFYYYKGRYFEHVNQLDSAEFYYRKVYRPNMKPVDMNPMYKGLLSVFQKRHQADSMAKYSQLYCDVNDSSIALNDQTLTAQLAASYRYHRLQQKALEKEKEIHQRDTALFLMSIAIMAIVALGGLIAKKYQKSQRGLREQQLLNFQSEQASTLTENKQLKKTVEDQKRQLALSRHKALTTPYFETAIVQRVRTLAKKNPKPLLPKDLELLVKTTNDYFPDLIHDLMVSNNISQLGLHVCLLVALNILPAEIHALLDISPSQISNLKQDINQALFQEHTARTLYKNLLLRYHLIV